MNGDVSTKGTAKPGGKPAIRAALGEVVPSEPVVVRAGIRTRRLVLRPLETKDREAYLSAARESRESLDAFMPLHRPGEADEDMFQRQLEIVGKEQAAVR